MSRALFTGVSGMRAHQIWLDVIGDNIANANTPGFKPSTVLFTDILGQTLNNGTAPSTNHGGTDPTQIGLGVTLGAIAPSFVQGSLQTTGKNTDVAIEGNGFFVLADGADRVYTRAGAFSLDAAGNLVDAATGFNVVGAAGNIQIPQGQESAAQETTAVSFKGNLDFTVPDGTPHVASFDVHDSLGAAHTLTITFTKNFAAAPGQWDWAVTESDTDISGLTTATGSVVFDASGAVSSGATQAIGVAYPAAVGVATPQAITLDFGSATSTTPLTGLATPSTVTLASQDGRAPGTLTTFSIGRDGSVVGFFSNGTTQVLDTIQLASFNNPSGLLKIGRNHFRESATSGVAEVGTPGTAGRGAVNSGSLEQSATDLAEEFTSMMIAQRGFQANARTITVANEVLEELVNLRRG
jgi:flagellar hook protein FlgE